MSDLEPKQHGDVKPDHKVASSRARTDDDGAYVGRASADDDFDSRESGAERRSSES